MIYNHKKCCKGEAKVLCGYTQLSEASEEWNDDFYLSSPFLSLQQSMHKETD